MGRRPFALRLGKPGDLGVVSGLVREAAEWLRTSKNTDQWAQPRPDRDAWTTNLELHAYLEGQRFVRLPSRDPASLPDYPSQALFERAADLSGSDFTKLFLEEERNDTGKFR